MLDWLRGARHQAVDSYLPDSDTVRGSCLEDVGGCDLYVLILGHRYGFQPPGDNPEGLSITQLEFRRAGECGIPRIALVRTRPPFAPFGLGDVSANQLKFTDPVVLLRAPFRVSFSYSNGEGSWVDTWQNAGELPAAVRFLVRDTTTGRTLAISSAAIVHVALPSQSPTTANAPGGPADTGPAARGNALRGP